MFARAVTSMSLLSLLALAPLGAQEYKRFNFDIGGGITTPLNPTANYVGVNANFVTGAGYNIDKHNSIVGEFMWAGLPPNLFTFHPIDAPFGTINLYTLTANYRYKVDKLGKSPFGVYAIAGGGWYYRRASIDQNYVAPGFTPCQPIFTWWGYACGPDGYVYTVQIAHRGVSSGGVNAGVGFTIRLTDSGLKFYVESRYHYAFSQNIPTTLIPVTFGFRFN